MVMLPALSKAPANFNHFDGQDDDGHDGDGQDDDGDA